MQIKFSVSLWTYYHYADVPSLERTITLLREQGYGIELWGTWKDEKDLYDEIGRKRLKNILQDISVSLHTAGANTLDLHKKQIDAAADLGAGIIVIHPDDILSGNKKDVDIELCRKAVAYATEHNVRLALENGELPFLIKALENVNGLDICLDVGHVYFTADPMKKFLDALKKRIIHLHIQDILPKTEPLVPHNFGDHYIPGTGGIPEMDWKLIATTLKEINFNGTAVFEIHPRDPFQTAFLGKNFIQNLLKK